MSNIKRLVLTFENCEYITIPGEYIGHFCVDKIGRKFVSLCPGYVSEMNAAGHVAFEVFEEADGLYDSFGKKSDKSIFGRICEYDDITSIEFTLEDKEGDEKKYSYYTRWMGDDDFVNPAQKSVVSKCGNLYVIIDKKNITKKDYFDSVFPERRINSEQIMKLYKKSCMNRG